MLLLSELLLAFEDPVPVFQLPRVEGLAAVEDVAVFLASGFVGDVFAAVADLLTELETVVVLFLLAAFKAFVLAAAAAALAVVLAAAALAVACCWASKVSVACF
jgi:hypothetical protein